MTFSEAAERLDDRFLVLIKGVAVNMDRIAQIEDGHCRMQDGRHLPLNVKRQAQIPCLRMMHIPSVMIWC